MPRELQKIIHYSPTQRIELGKVYGGRPYNEWRTCQFCQYTDLIDHTCGGDYYVLHMTNCPICGVMVTWET